MNPLLIVGGLFLGLAYVRRRSSPRRNLDAFTDSTGIHPIRGSYGYDAERVGEPFRASRGLRSFVADTDRRIKRARSTEARHELREARADAILSELPDRVITRYEEVQEKIPWLEASKMHRELGESESIHQFRGLTAIVRQYPEKDSTHRPLREAVKRRYGMSLDEIAAKLYPGESRGEEFVLRDAERLRQESRTFSSKSLDREIGTLKRFVKRVRTGEILGIAS